MKPVVKVAMGLGKKCAAKFLGKQLKSLKVVGTLLCVAVGVVIGLAIVCLFALAVMLSVKAAEQVIEKIKEVKKECPACNEPDDVDTIEASEVLVD